LVGRLPLPYPAGCAVLAFLIGSPGFFLASFLDTVNVDQAVSRTFFSSPLSVGQLQQWQFAFSDALFSLLTFYAFYCIRYMRQKLVRSEAEILPLLPNGEKDFHRAFRDVSRTLPIGLLALMVGTISVPYTLGRIQSGPGVFWITFNLAAITINSLGLATFIWGFLASLRGLRNIGTQPLKLKHYYEDTLFGLRPFGNLSLSLSFLFFSGLALIAMAVFFSPDPYSVTGASVFAVVGVAFFFLPLYSIHRRMIEAKHREHQAIRLQLARILTVGQDPSPPKTEATMSDLENRLSELKQVQVLELEAREVANLRTWPFDTQILGRLTVIVLSTTAAIIARIIIVFARL
jgi:hypothetical protein